MHLSFGKLLAYIETIDFVYGFYFQNINFNSCFDDEDIKKIKEETDKKIQELEEFVKTVKAHVGIAKTKEEVEEILKRYEILDKKSGKLVTE